MDEIICKDEVECGYVTLDVVKKILPWSKAWKASSIWNSGMFIEGMVESQE